MNKLLPVDELYEHIKENGITLCRITESFYEIPAGTMLWFGVSGDYLTTFDVYTECRNSVFGYTFNYQMISGWSQRYSGSFEVIESAGKTEQDIEVKGEPVYDLGISVNDTMLKKVITKDDLKKILDIIL